MSPARQDTATPVRRFSAGDFRVPLRYLPLLVGEASAARLLSRAGIAAQTDDARATLPSITFLNLCLEHMRRVEDESYGVAPAPVPRGSFGLLMAAASQGDDLADALQRFSEAAKILRRDLVIKVLRSRNRLQLSIAAAGERTARKEFMVELFAVTVQCALRWLTGKRLRPLNVRVSEPMPGFERSVLPVFCCPTLRGGVGVTFSYAPDCAQAPLLPVKYQHWAAAEFGEFMRLLEEAAHDITTNGAGAHAVIVNQVADLIAAGVVSESAAASQLGMSTASLRRRLAEGGASFRALLADAQRVAASTLLVTDKTFEDIAAELGFSDTRSLRRACQRWFGMTPVEYRRGRLRNRDAPEFRQN